MCHFCTFSNSELLKKKYSGFWCAKVATKDLLNVTQNANTHIAFVVFVEPGGISEVLGVLYQDLFIFFPQVFPFFRITVVFTISVL